MTELSTLQLPIIDIAAFKRGTSLERATIVAQVECAAREVGFMQITGHGIPDAAIAGLAAAIDGFFDLPMADKRKVCAPAVEINRGYSGPLQERLSYSLGVESAADLFEAFNIGSAMSDHPDVALPPNHYPENIWPAQPRDFRAQVEAWFAHAGALARTMTEIFAVALGLPSNYFVALQNRSVDTMRLNHYSLYNEQLPSAAVRLEPGQMGMGGHTDYGIVTVLWADAVAPGLQLMDADGNWHDVMPAPGALLINLGDMLARWTNDRWLSTMHRVLPPIDAQGRIVRRRSAAYFHDGNYDAVIACLPGCSDADHPVLYAPITVGEHLEAKLRGSRGLTLNATAEREAARLRKGRRCDRQARSSTT